MIRTSLSVLFFTMVTIATISPDLHAASLEDDAAALASPDEQARAGAAQRLRQAGIDAIPHLYTAWKRDGFEGRDRARDLLQDMFLAFAGWRLQQERRLFFPPPPPKGPGPHPKPMGWTEPLMKDQATGSWWLAEEDGDGWMHFEARRKDGGGWECHWIQHLVSEKGHTETSEEIVTLGPGLDMRSWTHHVARGKTLPGPHVTASREEGRGNLPADAISLAMIPLLSAGLDPDLSDRYKASCPSPIGSPEADPSVPRVDCPGEYEMVVHMPGMPSHTIEQGRFGRLDAVRVGRRRFAAATDVERFSGFVQKLACGVCGGVTNRRMSGIEPCRTSPISAGSRFPP